jgi:WhiB family redox-sensing transcriptional regulator
MTTLEWMAAALCRQRDGDLFFPEQGGSSGEAKKICMSCDVRADCLSYALTSDIRQGVWGGLSAHQRKRLQAKEGAA